MSLEKNIEELNKIFDRTRNEIKDLIAIQAAKLKPFPQITVTAYSWENKDTNASKLTDGLEIGTYEKDISDGIHGRFDLARNYIRKYNLRSKYILMPDGEIKRAEPILLGWIYEGAWNYGNEGHFLKRTYHPQLNDRVDALTYISLSKTALEKIKDCETKLNKKEKEIEDYKKSKEQ